MRLYTLVVSIGAHVAALVVLIGVPLVAMDVVPVARQIVFVRAFAETLPELPPPPPRGTRSPVTREASPSVAPVESPDRIEPEPADAAAPAAPPFEGPLGIVEGVDGALPLVNVLPPVAPPTRRDPVRPGGNIRAPTKIKHVAPMYPRMAQSAGRQGTVILEAVISEDGEVRQLRVLRSVPLLDEAAMDAVRQWRFTPTLLNGQPVPVVMTVTVAFELK